MKTLEILPRCTCVSPDGACERHGYGREHFIAPLGCGYYEVRTRADTHPTRQSTPAAPRDYPKWGSTFDRCLQQIREIEGGAK